jgi:hypothetical protein
VQCCDQLSIKELYFSGAQVFKEKKKLHVDLEPPSSILLSSKVMIIALNITKLTDLRLPLTKVTEHSKVQLI